MNCRLCGSEKLKQLKIENYYYCRNCEYIMLDEGCLPGFSEEAARYREHDNTRENEGYVKMFEDFISWGLEELFPEVETVLDFGCGPGPVLAELMEERGLKVDLYDPIFYPGESYQQKKYDLITSTEVFEHLHRPRQEIDGLLESLKPGGYLAVMTHFHPGPTSFHGWWYHQDPTHVGFFNKKSLAWITEKFSLKLLKTGEEKYVLWQK